MESKENIERLNRLVGWLVDAAEAHAVSSAETKKLNKKMMDCHKNYLDAVNEVLPAPTPTEKPAAEGWRKTCEEGEEGKKGELYL